MTVEDWKNCNIDLLYGNIEDLSNNKHGLMDTKTHKIIIPVKYDKPICFFEGIAIAKLNGKYGLIDENENIVLKFQYEEINATYDDDLYIVKLNGKYGMYHLTKKIVLPIKYDYIKGFPYLICIGLNNKYGFLDYTLQEVIPFIYNYIDEDYDPNNKLLCVGQGNKLGFIDEISGMVVIPIKYDKIIENENNYITVEKNGEIINYERNNNKWFLSV